MLNRAALFLALALSSAAASAACRVTPNVKTSSADGPEIARHRAFMIEVGPPNRPGYSPAARSAVVVDKARPRVEAELAQRGYVAAEQADLVVRLSAGVKEVADDPSGRAAMVGAPEEIDEVSTLFVDLYDRKAHRTLFSAAAAKEIHSKTVNDEDVAAAVTEMLEPVPRSAAHP